MSKSFISVDNFLIHATINQNEFEFLIISHPPYYKHNRDQLGEIIK